MLEALLWGAVAASSLIVGALAGVLRDWNARLIGLVLGFGAGALVASISFELAETGFRLAGAVAVALGLAAGAIVFYVADRAIDRKAAPSASGLPLLLGALLDGIPEQAVLGIGIADGQGVSLSLLIAIFVSNLPEAIGSATDMKSDSSQRRADPADMDRRCCPLRGCDARRLPTAGDRGSAIARRDQRVRRRRPVGDAGRVDDPGGHAKGR